MSANSILLFLIAGFLGLSATMMLVQPDMIRTLEQSLGPMVETQRL